MVSWWISHGVPLHAGMQVVSENVANDLRLSQWLVGGFPMVSRCMQGCRW